MKIRAIFTPLELIYIGIYLGSFTTLMLMVFLYHTMKSMDVLTGELTQGLFTGAIALMGFSGIVWVTRKTFKEQENAKRNH